MGEKAASTGITSLVTTTVGKAVTGAVSKMGPVGTAVAIVTAGLAAAAAAGYGIQSLVDSHDHAQVIDRASRYGARVGRRADRVARHGGPTRMAWLRTGGLMILNPLLGAASLGAIAHDYVHRNDRRAR